MNPDHAQAQPTTSHQRQSQVDTRLHGCWFVFARGIWIIVVFLTLGIFFASLPIYVAQLQTPCAGSACWNTQLTPEQAVALKEIGLSPGAYALYLVALTLVTMVVCLVVSTLIVWRRSDDRMAILVALLLMTFGPLVATSSVVAIPSPLRVPNECLYFLALALLVLVFLLFPSGQFVPRWMRWTLIVYLAGLVPTAFVAPFMPNTPVYQLTNLVVLGELATLAIVQLYRYRRVSSPMQRQQTKWVVFGIAVLVTVSVSGSVLELIFPVLASPGSLYALAFNVVGPFLVLLIPLSFGFAMLRSRLWEIDVLINRALVYGALTVILAVVYGGLVIALQALLRGIISQDNSVAIVISTLAIATMFQPLRRRIQRIIDRRFYRSKYDAAKIVAAFSTTLRHEVDLDTLREHLLAVVQETMQPTHISLWLRQPASSREQNTRLLPRIEEEERQIP